MPHSNTNLARRVVCNAHEYTRVPAVIADSWAQLKEAKGHPITPARMDRLHRQRMVEAPAPATIEPTPPPAPYTLAADMAVRLPRVTAFVANWRAGTSGDAA